MRTTRDATLEAVTAAIYNANAPISYDGEPWTWQRMVALDGPKNPYLQQFYRMGRAACEAAKERELPDWLRKRIAAGTLSKGPHEEDYGFYRDDYPPFEETSAVAPTPLRDAIARIAFDADEEFASSEFEQRHYAVADRVLALLVEQSS